MFIALKKQNNGLTKSIIAERAILARSFWERFSGLMLKKSFDGFDGMIFPRCNSIHTFFMMFYIDVVCLNASGAICNLKENMVPGRIFIAGSETNTLIELPKGTIEKFKISVGDQLEFIEMT
ncbi:MAG TPA: DUF192 domain-containing protein [bacterium]|nr:MAG: hypothetical protein BWY28_00054 [bacterium ADurb.Bin236]HOY64064.1 DUF192 domain-containing protein [bacterium]HPI75510.1 DUF192 domain-containing protein [bacterium]HPN94091.1 DUF192 domain-containing protein [bacterium]